VKYSRHTRIQASLIDPLFISLIFRLQMWSAVLHFVTGRSCRSVVCVGNYCVQLVLCVMWRSWIIPVNSHNANPVASIA